MATFADFRLAVRSRLPEWIPQVVRHAAAELGSASLRNAIASDRVHTSEVLAVLQGRAEVLAAAISNAIQHLMDEADRDAVLPARGPGIPALSLIAQEQIDEDIEIARIVQLIESEAEAEMRQLARLCSSLLGRDGIRPDAMPLHPGLCARALRSGLDRFDLSRPARLLLLRHTGQALGRQLKQVYAGQCELLVHWGVRPAQFRIQPNLDTAKRPAAAASPAAALPTEAPMASLQRLVAWAAQRLDPPVAGGQPALRLFSDPQPAGTGPRSLPAGAAVQVMDQLFAHLQAQSSLSPAARELVRRLQEPARGIAAREADLWTSLDHPWWQLLDRILSLGTVQDATEAAPPGAVTASLERVIDRLERARSVDRRLCDVALAEVDQVASQLLDERHEQLGSSVDAVQPLADRETLEIALRNQVVQQLQATPAPPGLRQFLLGPWVLAMTAVAVRHGVQSRPCDELVALVDDLLTACRPGGRPLSVEHQRVLIERSRTGLAPAGLSPERIAAELADLGAVLRDPRRAMEETWVEAQDTTTGEAAAQGNDGVPTVLIDMQESPPDEPSRAMRDCRAWLDALVPGTYCRMFLMGAWMTTQLTWVSGNRNLFVFSSRHGGRVHSMTRRALEKARGAGLAATIGHGLLLAQAMDTLTDSGDL